MRTVMTFAIMVGLLILAAGGFIYSGAYYVGADEPHWSITAWLLNEARDRSIRAHASGIAVPAGLDDPAKIVAGVSHYSEHCAVCHGAPGAERDDLAEGLYPRPPNLADASRVYTPGELFWIIKHGIRMTGMPSWADHSDDELWATVAFIQKVPGMTGQDYAKLVAASRAQGGHHRENREPQPESPPQAAEKEHDHPASLPSGAAQQAGETGRAPAATRHPHPAGRHQH
jgi:mono/diheme cytochrome c family protein